MKLTSFPSSRAAFPQRVCFCILPLWGLGGAWAMAQESPKVEEAVKAPSLESFRVAAPLKLQLVASEPMVFSPIALNFDKNGALWVVEYPGDLGDSTTKREAKPRGRVVKLEDTDKDGVVDKRSVFLDGLASPTTVMPFRDGVLVGDVPHLKFWKDTDGDGKADTHEVLASDFVQAKQPEAPLLQQPNHLTWSRDNWFEAAGYGKRFKLQAGKWIHGETEARGAWGAAQDDAGRWYYQKPDGKLVVDFLPAVLVKNGEAASALGVELLASQEAWPSKEVASGEKTEFVSLTSPYLYRGAFLPLDFYGNVFVSDPSLHVVRRNVLKYERDRISANNAYQKQELVASSDTQFHPLAFGTGFEGGLYVVDWHGENFTSLTQASTQGLQGRIYRLVSKERPLTDPYWPQTDREWIGYLGHANATLRTLAQQTLVHAEDKTLDDDLRVAMQSQENLIRRLHSMWTLEGRGTLQVKDLQPLCYDVDFKVRSAAVSLLGLHAAKEPKEREAALKLLLKLPQESSGDTMNRRMLALGKFDEAQALEGKVKLLSSKPKEPRLQESFFTFDDAKLNLGLLEQVVQGKTTFNKQRDLQSQLVLKLSERIWAQCDPKALQGWVNLWSVVGDASKKKTYRAKETEFLKTALVKWLNSQPEKVTMAQKPEAWEARVSSLDEASQKLAASLLSFEAPPSAGHP